MFTLCLWNDQYEYIKLLDYLTDPKERLDFQLLTDITWTNMLWMQILSNRFDKMKYFFTLQQIHAQEARICVKHLVKKYPIFKKLSYTYRDSNHCNLIIKDPIYY